MVSVILEAFSYLSWQFESAVMLCEVTTHEACMPASDIVEVFSYVGWQVEPGMKVCGWLVGFVRHLTIWLASQSGVASKSIRCGRQWNS